MNIDVQHFLNAHPFSRYQWMIFTFGFLIVLLDGFDTAAIGFVAPSLLKEWGITRQDLGPVLSASLFGLCAGAMLAGPVADRVGRKRVLAVAVLLFGAACLSSAFASHLAELTALRFVTGLGLGAAMPTALTLISEFCPDARRATLTNSMFCGFPLGAAFGGFLAAWMIPMWGWRSVLVLGGVAPLVTAVLIMLLMPESVRYMVAKAAPSARIRTVLGRISPSAQQGTAFVMSEPAGVRGSSVAVVLSRPFIVGSVMLWTTYFMGLVIFYALINWMPLLLKDSGLPPQTATLVSALFPLGGVGAVGLGLLMDRYNANLVTSAGYALTAGSVFLIGVAQGHLGVLVAAVLLAGVFMNTSQSSLGSLAASFYPTQGRATGVAWMMGVGRLGGIAGSFLVAELARLQFGFSGIFALIAVAGLIAAAALVVKHLAHPQR
jgi:AAHS family 4-hydroxybenzoate transporter-like MFS transporter